MKRFLLALLLTLAPAVSFAALSSSVVWEIETGGLDTNGGGFDPSVTSPGTDHSQQASAAFGSTDLVIAATTTNVTAVSHSFVAADIGNIIQITAGSGFTTGFYTIVSVATGIATLDRSAGTAASTGGTWAEGGALLTLAKGFGAQVVGGNTIWVKGGTYTTTTHTPMPAAAAVAGKVTTITGYSTTRGDCGVTWGSQTKVTTATNSTDLFYNNSVAINQQNWSCFYFSNTAATRAYGFRPDTNFSGSSGLTWANSVFDGFIIALVGNQAIDANVDGVTVYNNEFKNAPTTGSTYIQYGPAWVIYGNYLHDVAASTPGGCITGGIGSGNYNQVTVARNVFYKCGIGATGPNNGSYSKTILAFINNIFDSSQSDAITRTTSQSDNVMIVNNLFTNNGGWAIKCTSCEGSGVIYNNAFFNNTSGNIQDTAITAVGSITLTGPPYTSAATGDFTLNSTAGAGAAAKAVGVPGLFVGTGKTGALDLGVLQSAAAAPSGGVLIGGF